MDGKLRVILFVLLVTLFSVRGQDFSFLLAAYRHIKTIENNHRVFFHDVQNLVFENTHVEQDWAVVFVEEEGTKTMQMIPLSPNNIAGPAIVEPGIDGPVIKPLRHMSMSFSKVNHRNTGRQNVPNDIFETHYGIFRLCFKNPESDHHETCVYTHMFSLPPSVSSLGRLVGRNAFRADPISTIQLNLIKNERTFKWALQSLNAVLAEQTQKAVLSTSNIPVEGRSPLTALGISLQLGGSAFFLSPIIVDEHLLREYYALVTR